MATLDKLVLPEIRELIQAKDFATLREILAEWLAPDVAMLVAKLDPDEQEPLFQSLDVNRAAEIFSYMEFGVQEFLVESLPIGELARILDGMPPDDRTSFLVRLPAERAQRLLSLLAPAERKIAESLLSYPADSIGRLMTPDYIAVKEVWTIDHVLDFVRVYGKDSETLNAVYVTDEHCKLIDDIRMRQILLSPLTATVRDLMDRNFVYLRASHRKREAVDFFRRYGRSALPVVADDGTLLGIVTIDDVLDVAEREATREIQRLGGSEALEEPYMSTPLLTMVKKRASWLVVLFLGELLTATAIGFFESEIERAVVLAMFIPLIISSGGNSGSQAATLMVRALALGEVRLRQWRTVLGREIVSGLLLGVTLGTIGFARIALWSAFTNWYGPHWLLVATTVGISLVGVVLWGALSGAMLPFALRRVGFDPATSSAPFVATMVDVTGLVIYFSVALVLLRGTLL
jgi:magnesium transporter